MDAEKTKTETKSVSKEKIKNDFKKVKEDLTGLAKTAKAKYDKSDPKTKKMVLAGVAGAAALIAGAIGYKKMKNKK